MELMQEKTTRQLENIFIEHERSKSRLKDHEKELRAREAVNDIEKRKLDSDKKKNQLAIMEQAKADERMLKLAEDQKILRAGVVANVEGKKLYLRHFLKKWSSSFSNSSRKRPFGRDYIGF